VLDQWFEQDVKPRLKGTSFMLRYADDAVLGFERQEDAERVFAVLAKRFEKYALTLHSKKTRLIARQVPPHGHLMLVKRSDCIRTNRHRLATCRMAMITRRGDRLASLLRSASACAAAMMMAS
jgi:hypothetical protein